MHLQNCLYFFILHGEVYIFCINVISRLIGLICENIAQMANKIFNVPIPNHLKYKVEPATSGIYLIIEV